MNTARREIEHDRIRRYAAEVDDRLLALPYRERAEAVAGLTAHLHEGAGVEELPGPAEYARELAMESGTPTRQLRFMGLSSTTWPTPAEWIASGVRGVAALYLMAILWSVTLSIGSDVVSAGGPLLPAIDHGIGAVMRVPQLGGSETMGAMVLLPLSWVAGQVATGWLLDRDPAWRRRLNRATAWAVGLLGLVCLYIVTDMFR
ncbi:hypothetical protein [Streptomyces sp. NPDC005805]|uniref:hypothetical protein n=1 Tax=Streptomyces sp. NPDC005805 TaxID=3157068 RepID=UPI0033DD4D90